MKKDSEIQADVMQELAWDPRVTHPHIGVAVEGGIVTLSGKVPSFAEKWAAEKAAQRVAGVKAVVEEMKVSLPGELKRDDSALAKAIVEQFKWNVQVPDNLIKVRVERGWVELIGEVEWHFQKDAAEKSVRKLAGVIGVTNNIKIKEKDVQPDIIKKRIEEALKREIEREARRISVVVEGSKVRLSGNVHSFREKWDARGAALSAPGVTSVENNLEISN